MRKSIFSWLFMLGFMLTAGLYVSVARADEKAALAEAEAVDPAMAGGQHHEANSASEQHAENGPPMSFTGDLALWSLVVFVLFLCVLKKLAWLPMIEGLDKREAGIRKAISDAEEARRKSQGLLAEYEQKLKLAEQTVQAMVAEAERDAERTKQDMIAGARREVEAVRDRAKDDIRQAKDTALAEVFTQMNVQVVRATEHVLGRVLQDLDQDRLVSEALAEVSR
ncbi:MAG: F0F1 ATP synthase subunit B [Planctomycetota bacterium]